MTVEELNRDAQALEGQPPAEALAWASAQFGDALTFATGFGVEGVVLLDMAAARGLRFDVFTLDTGLLFPETYALWRALEARYGIAIRGVKPARTVEEQARDEGERLWEHHPDRCCALRKVEPLRQALAGRGAWITAIRRDQTPQRASAQVVEWDATYGLVKVNPLVSWTARDVWRYATDHGVPYNPLHDRGYASIGCWPCTSSVLEGEGERAGRWRNRGKSECGIHLPLLERKTG